MTGGKLVIPAQVTFPVIPAKAGIQGALGPRLRGDDAARHLRGDDAARHLRGDDGARGTP